MKVFNLLTTLEYVILGIAAAWVLSCLQMNAWLYALNKFLSKKSNKLKKEENGKEKK